MFGAIFKVHVGTLYKRRTNLSVNKNINSIFQQICTNSICNGFLIKVAILSLDGSYLSVKELKGDSKKIRHPNLNGIRKTKK